MAEVAIVLAVILVLIAINGLFVAAEFALVMAPRATMERLAETGHRAAIALRRVLTQPVAQDRYIATAQLGITAASLGLGMYGEHALAEWIYNGLGWVGLSSWIGAHALASVVAITVLTYLHIVFGEMIPKSLTLQKPETAALWLVRPVRWALWLAYPIVVTLTGIGNGLLRLFGVQRGVVGKERYYTPEELQYVVNESSQGGLLRAESGRVINDLLEFGELTAGEVMVPRTKVYGLPSNATQEEIKQIILESRHTRYPVYEGNLDHILGIAHIKVLFRALLAGTPLATDSISQVPRVPEGMTLDRVMEAMRGADAQIVIVMDEHGGTAGLLTMEDLFEEIVGEIEEDDDPTIHPEIYEDDQARLHASGAARLAEVGEYLDVDLEHEDVDSVSGLVLLLLGQPASLGDTVQHNGYQFTVTQVAGLGVEECLITAIPPTANDEPANDREP